MLWYWTSKPMTSMMTFLFKICKKFKFYKINFKNFKNECKAWKLIINHNYWDYLKINLIGKDEILIWFKLEAVENINLIESIYLLCYKSISKIFVFKNT